MLLFSDNAMQNDQPQRASLQVAPLALSRTRSSSFEAPVADQSNTLYAHKQMTPPDTPNGSQEALAAAESAEPAELMETPVFHNFLRAFYPFHPTYAMADSSVTLPLDEGDVVLIHSIHTNGWADGTRLLTGARGWLPTNYCEPYEPDDITNLLNALLNFWDLLRSTSVDDTEMFSNQEFMKGLIAGVRFLLERTNCLNRESVVIQRCEPLRKCRKSLLSELSSLVKTGKRLQDTQGEAWLPVEDVNDIVDEMILRAFKIITKGVRFLDVLEDDRKSRTPAAVTVMATVVEESTVPPTPPADRSAFDDQSHENASDAGSRVTLDDMATSVATSESTDAMCGTPSSNKRWIGNTTAVGQAIQASPQANRLSANFSHRMSLAGPSPLSSRPNHLVSERLNRSHDKFLSHLGSFIGRLHLQSQSRPDLALAIKQSALSGGELLAVVTAICGYNSPNPEPLRLARHTMSERIRELVFSARDTMIHAATEEADVIMLQDNSILLMSATGCVRAAGDCVAKAKITIERIGDFEIDVLENALDMDLSMLDDTPQTRTRADSVATRSDAGSTTDSIRTSESSGSSTRKMTALAIDKPLPKVPEVESSAEQDSESTVSEVQVEESKSTPPAPSARQSLPPLPRLSTNHPSTGNRSTMDSSTQDQDMHSSRFDSLAGSSAGSSATYLSRDSETGMSSQTSTRATTPEQLHAPRHQPSVSDLSSTGSAGQPDEVDDLENRLLERTFAHELLFNKEGQVTGGSLPALVERLTSHDSKPDATFVSTFYLTFRLFCSPIKLSEALIERFEYVGDHPRMSGPVRLRVYNAFKGWMESHWRDETDRVALGLIIPFAELRLMGVIPTAGRRLLELAQRVSGDGSLVPRLVSSMAKTNTGLAMTVPVDAPIPQATISRSQQHLLTAWKNGGAIPAVLDFEAAEIARQLTIRQMNIFCSIMPEELLASQWMKNGGVDAPNVRAMSSLTTDLSNLVAESILQHQEIKKRATAIKQWIKIAQHCLELNNYDGLMAIIASLNSTTITRLRKTWDLVSSKRKEALRVLQEVVEPSQNHKALRTKLAEHVPPCLPFLGMYLTDLTFTDIGNPATKQISLGKESEDEGQNGLTVVNFDKHTRTAKIIGELQRFQIPYRLASLPDMQDWLTALVARVREADQANVQVTYYRKSLLLEPRETAALRAATEPTATPLPPPSGGSSRTDLFGWMTRGNSATTTATTTTTAATATT